MAMLFLSGALFYCGFPWQPKRARHAQFAGTRVDSRHFPIVSSGLLTNEKRVCAGSTAEQRCKCFSANDRRDRPIRDLNHRIDKRRD